MPSPTAAALSLCLFASLVSFVVAPLAASARREGAAAAGSASLRDALSDARSVVAVRTRGLAGVERVALLPRLCDDATRACGAVEREGVCSSRTCV